MLHVKLTEKKNIIYPNKSKQMMEVHVPKGDELDSMLYHYINQANCKVPIRKLGNGFYLFGTKKIYAKILNGKLVIRVGGGYMIIEEFIATYQDAEINKLAKMSDEQIKLLGQGSQEAHFLVNENAKLTQYRSSVRKSSPHGLMDGIGLTSSNKMNGTTRGKSFIKN